MHSLSKVALLLVLSIVINARLSASFGGHRSCPEEYRELRRRSDEPSSGSDDDDSDDDWREDICDQAMSAAGRERDSIKNKLILRTYCAHYDEAMELGRENNDSLCQEKKRQVQMKRKRQVLKKKRNNDSDSSDDNDDDDDSSSDDSDQDDKRRGLKKREFSKRFALRFIRKRMP